jgi:hypothetical protein
MMTGELARFPIAVTDLNNAPISTVAFGTDFKLRTSVQDIRTTGTTQGEYGVYAAAMDVNYSSSIVRFKGPGTFGPNYSFVPTFDASTPGLINEISAGYTDLIFPVGGIGTGAFPFFDAVMHAGAQPDFFTVDQYSGQTTFNVLPNDSVGGVATFNTDHADDGSSQTIFWDPGQVVDPIFIQVEGTSLTHTSLAASPLDYNIVSVTQGVHGGTIRIAADRKSVDFIPAAGFAGNETFTYTITDGVAFDTATVTVTVIGDTGFRPLPLRSAVYVLPEVAYTNDFLVTWGGETDSSLQITGYDIYYQIDNQPRVLWQSNTLATSATFSLNTFNVATTGRRHDISFFSVAHDNSRDESEPSEPDIVTHYAGAPWQNPYDADDADDDGEHGVSDILLLIFEYNQRRISQANGQVTLPPVLPYEDGPYPDLTGDNKVDVNDILRAIFVYNQEIGGSGEAAVLPSHDQPASETSSDAAFAALLWAIDDEERRRG